MPLPFLEIPLMLAPMAGPSTPRLVAAVSERGGLGIAACAYATPERILAEAAEIRALTARPFGINLFVETPLAAPGPALARAHERLRSYRDELGIPHAAEPPLPPERYDAQIDALIAARPAVASFTFGIPSPEVMRRLREAGIFTLGTATTVAEAVACEGAGMDAIVAQGAEAGGHRGTFLLPAERSLVGTIALVPQIARAVAIPVVAAGGIGDGRGLAAVLALGASAAALSTAFLLADEAATPPSYRAALASERASDTAFTNVFSGRSARGIVNRMMREIAPEDVAPYPYQNALTRDVRTAATAAGRGEFLSLWAGQAASLSRPGSARAIVDRVLAEARVAADEALSGLPG